MKQIFLAINLEGLDSYNRIYYYTILVLIHNQIIVKSEISGVQLLFKKHECMTKDLRQDLIAHHSPYMQEKR